MCISFVEQQKTLRQRPFAIFRRGTVYIRASFLSLALSRLIFRIVGHGPREIVRHSWTTRNHRRLAEKKRKVLNEKSRKFFFLIKKNVFEIEVFLRLKNDQVTLLFESQKMTIISLI